MKVILKVIRPYCESKKSYYFHKKLINVRATYLLYKLRSASLHSAALGQASLATLKINGVEEVKVIKYYILSYINQ